MEIHSKKTARNIIRTPREMRLALALLVLSTWLLFSASSFASESGEMKRVLILHSFKYGLSGNVLMDSSKVASDAIQATMEEGMAHEIAFHSERMDVSALSENRYFEELRDAYRKKYDGQPIDLIIAVNYRALNFLNNHGEELWPKIPIVFCGVEEGRREQLKQLRPNITGLFVDAHFGDMLDFIFKIHPDTQHIKVIVGTSETERFIEARVRQAFLEYVGRVDFTYLSDFEFDAILSRVADLPPNSIVLFLTLLQDGKGMPTPENALPLISRVSNAPVYGLFDVYVGHGIVGGSVYSVEYPGIMAGKLGVRILAGEKPRDIHIGTGQRHFSLYDWRQLKRWGIAERDLPPKSIVRYREPTFYGIYKWYIWGGISLVLFQMVMIFLLLINSSRRRRAEESIKQQLQIQALFTRVSTRFTTISPDEIDSAINEGFAQIGKHLDIGRIALLQFSSDKTELHLTHGYASHAEDRPLNFIVSEKLPWFSGSLIQGKILRISKAEDIPKEAVAERQYMKAQGFKSFLTIPMIISDSVIGAISYSNMQQEREWSDELISQLGILTEMYANALKRKQTEKELHESEKRYRSLVDESPAANLVIQDGHFIFSNPAGLRMLGFSGLKDIVGRPALDVVLPAFHELVIQRMESLAQGKSNPIVEIELLKTDGTIISVETTSVPTQIGGKPAGLVICNDITKRKLSEMKLLKSREDFRHLAGKLLSVQEAERRRLAREMHDDLTQRLAVLAIDIGKMELKFQDSEDPVLETLRSIRERLVNLSGDVHAISRQLHPSILEDLGLADAIKSECNSFTKREGIAVDYRTETMPPGISADVAICIYRIVQEGLRNVAKHADTTQLQVSLTGKDDSIHLMIKDQGAGFDLKEMEKKLGLGLVSMQERVRLIQGNISIESRPGKGTVINVRTPAGP